MKAHHFIKIAVSTAAQVSKISVADICGKAQYRQVVEYRCCITSVALGRGAQSRELARYMNKSDASITHYKVLHRNLMETDPHYRKQFKAFHAAYISSLSLYNHDTWLIFQAQMQTLARRFPNKAEFIHALYDYLQTQND